MRSMYMIPALILAFAPAAHAFGFGPTPAQDDSRIMLAAAHGLPQPTRAQQAAFNADIREARSETANAVSILRAVERKLDAKPSSSPDLKKKVSFVIEKTSFATAKLREKAANLEQARPALEEAVVALRLPLVSLKDGALATSLAEANASVSWALRLVQKWLEPRYAAR